MDKELEISQTDLEDVFNTKMRITQDLTTRLEEAMIKKAWQSGYLQACVDNGVSQPEFVDPEITLGLVSDGG